MGDGAGDAVVNVEDEGQVVDQDVARTVAYNDGEMRAVRVRATEPEEVRPDDILVEGRRHEGDGAAMGP